MTIYLKIKYAMIILWILTGFIIIYNYLKKKLTNIQLINSSSELILNKIQILYHSDNYLIINKPYDIVVNSDDTSIKTLQTELRIRFPKLANPSLKHEFHFVHRLDYPTSGVMCIALNKNSARSASNAFEKRLVKKYYLALVHGHVNQSYLVINQPIGQDNRELVGNKKMCTSDNIHCEKPRKCCTALLVLEKGLRDGRPATKVLLRPITGRRHQLRVHCFYIGHTIIGDYTYSDRKDSKPHRTFLHSFRLILESDSENLDIQTQDPFISNVESNKWIPTAVIRNLDTNTFNTIDQLI